ncbi:Polyphosphate kinase [Nymphon striatum]|nr:Polyphosphate kinase [Nymphon striatum]
MSEQLAFSLPAKEALGRENYFVSAANALAVAAVENWANWPLRKLVLVGPAGSGKTHLAMVWAHDADAHVISAQELEDPNLAAQSPLVVEDLHLVAGDKAQETQVFHLHNLMQERGYPLLVTSALAPARMNFALPDLKSRMEGTSIATLEALDDALLMALVMKMFSDRQIAIKPDLLNYVLPRLPRSFEAVRGFVETIDARALSEKRPIGKGLARDVLAEISTLPMCGADFLTADYPDPVEIADLDVTGPSRFFNRELSWLAFNWRVLDEASNPRVPLMERVRFLAISSTNLDEFYTVRVAGLRELANAGNRTPSSDGRTPEEQLVLIDQNARALITKQDAVWEALKGEMEASNIWLLDADGLSDADREVSRQLLHVETSGAPEKLRGLIMKSLEVTEKDVIEISGMIGLSDLSELVSASMPNLLWPPFSPRVPERVQDNDGDMFAAIRQKDMLLHHPYESFDMVVRFLAQAARDPDVVAIKQTLYRTSNQSPIVEALCEAAENGKSVTALRQIFRQSRKLERSGAHVVYGFINYKTHAKISTVVRREGDTLVTYTHYGTGNYHPITARIYTDLSLFTCDASLGRDATKVFNFIGGYAQPERLENLYLSPAGMKKKLIKLIDKEAGYAAEGKPAEIWAKMNAVVEVDVIDALYRASQAGVKINLVVRGICAVRPGIKGLSENIRVKSIVGRFLEHSRIVCFGNGHGLPSKKAKVYMSSADWMSRNLNRRVETLVEISN